LTGKEASFQQDAWEVGMGEDSDAGKIRGHSGTVCLTEDASEAFEG
jgi:hypothetical protein